MMHGQQNVKSNFTIIRTVGRTDGHEANSRFSQFCEKRPKCLILLSKLIPLMQMTHRLHIKHKRSKPVGKSRKSKNTISGPEIKEAFENRR